MVWLVDLALGKQFVELEAVLPLAARPRSDMVPRSLDRPKEQDHCRNQPLLGHCWPLIMAVGGIAVRSFT